VRKTTPNIEKKHEINSILVESIFNQTKENRFISGEKLGFGKNIIRNTIPKTAINP
jgi:hypothetical protein